MPSDAQGWRGRIRDVVDVEAVEVADEGMVALKRQVRVQEPEVAGVGRVEEAGRLVEVRAEVQALGGDAGVVQAGGEPDARIIGRR